MSTDRSDKHSSIQLLVDEFLSACAEGSSPSIESLVESHPGLMPELEQELRKARMIAVARRKVRHDTTKIMTAADSQKTRGPTENDSTNMDGLSVRCPNCRAPIQIFVDTPWTEITCTACGSPFSLVNNHFETRQAKTIKTLGHFELIERIGLGGFGSVLESARHHVGPDGRAENSTRRSNHRRGSRAVFTRSPSRGSTETPQHRQHSRGWPIRRNGIYRQ